MGERNRTGVRVERREGRKILVIDFTFRDKSGRRVRYRRDASVQTRGGANAEADRLRRFAAEHGTLDITPTAPTFEHFVREQFEPLVMPSYSPATRERYARLLWKEGVIATLGRNRIDAIGAREFRALDAAVRERGVIPRQHLVIVRRVLATAVEHGVIASMPSLPKVQKQQSKLPAAPSREVVTALIDAATGALKVAIAVAFYASCRSGEARALRVGDIGLDVGLLRIRRAISHDELWTPKGRTERAVPIALPLREILTAALRGRKPSDLLLGDDLGNVPTRQKLYKAFVALQKRQGVDPPWSFHALRHAFGSHVLRNGGNVEAVRELMGHRDLETTARYLHAIADDKRAAISTLN